MTPQPVILASAQAKFPKSANKTVLVASAWRRSDSTLERPEPNGSDGWTAVNKPATREVVEALHADGFSRVNLQASGTANPLRDADISDLI